MTNEPNNGKESQKFYSCCDYKKWSKRRLARYLRFGIILIAVGLLWYIAKTGILPMEVKQILWPFMLICIGAWIAIASFIKKKKLGTYEPVQTK